MELIAWIGLFIVSLAVLIKAAEYFTNTSERVGLHFKIPPFIVGVTIIAVGTSLPEVATGIMAVINNESEMVAGNAVGSNMANILLVMAIAAIIGKTIKFNKDILHIDLPILIGSTILLFMLTLNGRITWIEGIILLIVLAAYIVYNSQSKRKLGIKETLELKKLAKTEKGPVPAKYFLILAISAIFLYFGAQYTIKSVVEISELLQVGTEIIALTAIAIGTSLPELAVSVLAVKKGKIDMAIGNITGSSIFNVLGVMGIPALFGTLTVTAYMTTFAIPILLFVTILYAFTTMNRKISRWEGITFLLIYIAFLGITFGVI